MPVYSTIVGKLQSFYPNKEEAGKGTLSIAVSNGTGELSIKQFPYRRFSESSLQQHVGVLTAFNLVDGVVTGYSIR